MTLWQAIKILRRRWWLIGLITGSEKKFRPLTLLSPIGYSMVANGQSVCTLAIGLLGANNYSPLLSGMADPPREGWFLAYL